MKKVLFTANLDSFFTKFLIPQLKYYKELGYEVHIASKNENIDIPYCDKKFNVSFSRSLNIKQIKESYMKIKEILEQNEYEFVSCHTPFGAAIPRLAISGIKNFKSKVIYTAHGFHFYKGAPLKNWLLYFPMERYLSKYTTSIITINKEDYKLSKKHMACNTFYVPGIGLENEKFNFNLSSEEKKELYNELKLEKKDFIMIFPGELNNNKNQELLLNVLSLLLPDIPNAKLLLPGNDLLNGSLQKKAKELGIEKSVRFLGFRNDIPKLLKISNLALSSSKREGLPVNIMEAMIVGIPVVATNCRGNADLIKDGVNGFLIKNFDALEFSKKIKKIYFDKSLSKKLAENGKKKSNDYLIDNVLKQIIKIYER